MAKKLVCSRLPNGLFYSDDDIGGLYREASDKIEQVKILCELNLCKPPEIIEALKRCGYKKSELPIVTKVKTKSQNPLFKNRFRYHMEMPPPPKKRGRPKGSKNKPITESKNEEIHD